jgi:hypothetical protein
MDVDPQADPGGYGDPEAETGISIQRARVALDAETDQVLMRVEVGSSAPYDTWFDENAPSPSIDIQDAWVAWAPTMASGSFRLFAGSVRVPLFREELISSRSLTFQERGVAATHLSPGRELGVMLDEQLDMGLRIRAGAFNGGGDFFGDSDDGLAGVLRLEWAKGDTYRTWSPDRDVAFGIAAAGLFEQEIATRTVGGQADMLLRAGGFCLLAEGGLFRLAPTAGVTADLPDVFEGTGRFGLTGQMSYTIGLPDGGLEIAGRYSRYDDATGIQDNGDVGIVHGGLVWHDLSSAVDLGAGYILRMEHGGQSFANDTVRAWVQVRTLNPQ